MSKADALNLHRISPLRLWPRSQGVLCPGPRQPFRAHRLSLLRQPCGVPSALLMLRAGFFSCDEGEELEEGTIVVVPAGNRMLHASHWQHHTGMGLVDAEAFDAGLMRRQPTR